MDIELIATQVGDALKYSTTLNEINRIAKVVFKFPRKEFPNEFITSERAQLIYDWIMTLGDYSCSDDERKKLLMDFVKPLAHGMESDLMDILSKSGLNGSTPESEASKRFDSYRFHPEIVKHCRSLFEQQNYFHAIFEAAKAYNGLVKSKVGIDKDGQDLMMHAWHAQNGILKVNSCRTETEQNVQEGIRFMSAGLMRAVRNPTAHETALQWPVDELEATEILSLVSFLLRQYDKSVCSPQM